MKSSIKRKAVFFDRDGVLNINKGYVHRRGDFEWIPGAQKTICFLKKAGYLVFVVTNQGGVARGYYQEKDIQRLHQWMNLELAKIGTGIDRFYYCPHFAEGVITRYRKVCNCRKPSPGMILQAFDEWSIERSGSFLVGDQETDLQAAANAGLPGYLFATTNLYDYLQEQEIFF